MLIQPKSRVLSIQQKLQFEISEIPPAEWNGTRVYYGCTDQAKATTRLLIVLVSRMQKSDAGDNNFDKWKGTFRPTEMTAPVKVDPNPNPKP